jgi:hypothetical protein
MNSINNIYDEEPNTPTFKKGILNSQFNNVLLPINDSNNNEFINPEINTYNQNNNNNINHNISAFQKFYPNYINPTHNAQTRLFDIDNKISKYSDFISICYFMFICSILCFLISIFNVSYSSGSEIDDIYEEENNNKGNKNYKWYYILGFFINFYHCLTYFYSIRAYNHQSKYEMGNSNIILLSLIIINFLYFFIYLFFVHVSFFTFCIDIMFLIFNLLLYFQSKELTKLYEEKEGIKLVYA